MAKLFNWHKLFDLFETKVNMQTDYSNKKKNSRTLGTKWDRPYSVVRAAGHNKWIAVLQAGNASLVPIERPHKLARRHIPHFDCPVTGRWNNVPAVKVDDIHGSTVTDEHATEADVRCRVHVPHRYWPVLTQSAHNHNYLYSEYVGDWVDFYTPLDI